MHEGFLGRTFPIVDGDSGNDGRALDRRHVLALAAMGMPGTDEASPIIRNYIEPLDTIKIKRVNEGYFPAVVDPESPLNELGGRQSKVFSFHASPRVVKSLLWVLNMERKTWFV